MNYSGEKVLAVLTTILIFTVLVLVNQIKIAQALQALEGCVP